MANAEGTMQRSKGLFFLERYEEGRSGAPGFQMQSTYIRGLSCSTGLGGKMIVEGLRWANGTLEPAQKPLHSLLPRHTGPRGTQDDV